MKKIRGDYGITLIALVITIIVMLILVSVTISMAVNGGLFGYARNASVETKQRKDEELEIANIASGGTYEDLIDKYTIKYGLSADGGTFIGKPTDNPERKENGSEKFADGYKFTEGYFIVDGEYVYCSDNGITTLNNYDGYVDVYHLSSGEFFQRYEYSEGTLIL